MREEPGGQAERRIRSESGRNEDGRVSRRESAALACAVNAHFPPGENPRLLTCTLALLNACPAESGGAQTLAKKGDYAPPA
jgi:hypothetical protein